MSSGHRSGVLARPPSRRPAGRGRRGRGSAHDEKAIPDGLIGPAWSGSGSVSPPTVTVGAVAPSANTVPGASDGAPAAVSAALAATAALIRFRPA